MAGENGKAYLCFFIGRSLTACCHVNDGGKINTPTTPYELSQPINPRETKAIAMGNEVSCFLDGAGHPHCWSNPKRFIQDQDASSRGGFAMDYPKKSNADFAGHRFVNLDSDGGVCAVRDDNKVLYFMPDDVVETPLSDLSI